MRRWIPVTLMVVGLAASAAGAEDRSRMTFRCHDTTEACNSRFFMNGAETFLRGVYDSGFSSPPTDWELALFDTSMPDVRYYRQLNTIPINAYLNYYQGTATLDTIQKLLTVLSKHRVMWFHTANCSGDGSYKRYPFSVDQYSDGYFAQHLADYPPSPLLPAMAGYYVMDECGDSSYGTNLVPETQSHHAILKGNGTNGPLFDPAAKNFAVPIARGYRDPNFWISPPNGDPDPRTTSAATADLFGTDPYPMYNSEPRTGYPHFEVADYIARLRDDVPKDKPVVGVLQFFKFGNAGRLPTKAEMRMHAYAAIVEGAQGLFWWDIGENGVRKSTMKTKQISDAMQNLRDLVTELKSLEPALLATPTPDMLTDVTPKKNSPREWRIAALQSVIPLISNYADKQWYQAELSALTNTPPPYPLSPMLNQPSPQSSFIRTRVSAAEGYNYIIAYNYGNAAVSTATFTWKTTPTINVVEVVGEGRTITITAGNQFTDTFAPYQAHVYKFH